MSLKCVFCLPSLFTGWKTATQIHSRHVIVLAMHALQIRIGRRAGSATNNKMAMKHKWTVSRTASEPVILE